MRGGAGHRVLEDPADIPGNPMIGQFGDVPAGYPYGAQLRAVAARYHI